MIINPWFFYLMYVADGIGIVAVIALIFSALAAIITGIPMMVAMIDESAETAKAFKKAFKIAMRIICISSLVITLVPNEETILMMQAAKLATPENVNAVFESLKDAVDYVISVIG